MQATGAARPPQRGVGSSREGCEELAGSGGQFFKAPEITVAVRRDESRMASRRQKRESSSLRGGGKFPRKIPRLRYPHESRFLRKRAMKSDTKDRCWLVEKFRQDRSSCVAVRAHSQGGGNRRTTQRCCRPAIGEHPFKLAGPRCPLHLEQTFLYESRKSLW